MKKIQKISSYIIKIFDILLIIIPLTLAIQWVFITTKTAGAPAIINSLGFFEKMILTPEGYVNLSDVKWTLPLRLLGFISEIIGLLPFLISLVILKSIFKKYKKREVFSTSNAEKYKKLGWLALLEALIIKPLSNTFLIVAVTLSNPPGHRYITINFGTPNLKVLFLGVLIIIISWVMLEASKIHNEQKFTI